jgi:DNA (cytosine-5)-methyltransferase 1
MVELLIKVTEIRMKMRMKSSKPTVLDLFCGAGGMSLGFQNAGCEILGGIDSNLYAIMTHNKNFPRCILKMAATDINQIKFEKLPLNPGDIFLIGGSLYLVGQEFHNFIWDWLR